LVDLVDSSKSRVRRYVYDGDNILLETDGDGKILAYYFHTPAVDHPVAMLRDLDHSGSFTSNEVFSYTRDHLGSIRELVDFNGKVVQRYRYSTFGKTTVEKANGSTDHQLVDNIFAYTGREYDSDTQFYGYRNRYYSPEMGRFISPDPIGLQSGDLNFYRYVKNNPMNHVDPTGQLSIMWTVISNLGPSGPAATTGSMIGGTCGAALGTLSGIPGGNIFGGVAGSYVGGQIGGIFDATVASPYQDQVYPSLPNGVLPPPLPPNAPPLTTDTGPQLRSPNYY